MKKRNPKNYLYSCIFLSAVMFSSTLNADEKYDLLKRNYDQLQEQVQQLTSQMETLRSQIDEHEEIVTNTEALQATVSDKLLNASAGDSIFHITGYTDVGYTDVQSGDGSFGVGHFAPIIHYQYKDILLLESELAFELETNEEGETETETELEYLALDLFLNDYMTLVAGKFLSPIGQFQQNLHPSWINKLPSAPIGFGGGHAGGATPLADIGVQLRGGVPVKDMKINYSFFAGNGPRIEAEEETPGNFEIEALDTSGTVSDINGDKSFGGRIGFLPMPNLEIGISGVTAQAAYAGDANISNRDYDVYGADFYYAPGFFKNLTLRGEYVKTELGAGNASEDDPEARSWEAWYLQGSYLIEDWKTEPVIRYGEFEDAHGVLVRQWTPGINYRFSNNIIAKFAYEFNDSPEDESDRNRYLLQLAYGF